MSDDRPGRRRGGAHRRKSEPRWRRRRESEPGGAPADAEHAVAELPADVAQPVTEQGAPAERSAAGQQEDGAEHRVEERPAGDDGERAGWLTSPPLREEPWAGLPEGREEPSRARRLTWRGTRLVALVLAVAALLVLGGLNIVARLYPGPPTNPYATASTKAAVAAATAVAVPILSYDYQTIGKQESTVRPLVTASCASEYANLLATTVTPLATQNKATQQAAVLAAGVSSASANAVTVLAFVQLTSSNSVKTGKAINEAQLSLSMVRQHGRWLLAGTSAGGSPDAGPPSCGGVGAPTK